MIVGVAGGLPVEHPAATTVARATQKERRLMVNLLGGVVGAMRRLAIPREGWGTRTKPSPFSVTRAVREIVFSHSPALQL